MGLTSELLDFTEDDDIDDDAFFQQLVRGTRSSYDTMEDKMFRIPETPDAAARHVSRLVRHIEDQVVEAIEVIENILRWHGGEQIREILGASAPNDLTAIEVLRMLFPREVEDE